MLRPHAAGLADSSCDRRVSRWEPEYRDEGLAMQLMLYVTLAILAIFACSAVLDLRKF